MKRAKDNKASASTPHRKRGENYVVRVARNLSNTPMSQSAYRLLRRRRNRLQSPEGDKLDNLKYERGDDREGPYTCDFWRKKKTNR